MELENRKICCEWQDSAEKRILQEVGAMGLLLEAQSQQCSALQVSEPTGNSNRVRDK